MKKSSVKLYCLILKVKKNVTKDMPLEVTQDEKHSKELVFDQFF